MNFSKLKNQDWIITAITFLLLLIGSILIYSTTFEAQTTAQGAGSLAKQLIFILIGLGIYFFLITFDYSVLKIGKIQVLLYILIILLLIVVLFTDPINNARRWINIGFINIQPSEFAKIIVILTTANIFSFVDDFKSYDLPWKTRRRKEKIENNEFKIEKITNILDKESLFFKILLSIASIIPIFLLVFMQPAFGSSIIVFMIWVLLLFLVFPGQIKIIAIASLITLLSLLAGKVISLDFIYSKIGISFIVGGFDLLLILLSLALGLFLFYKLKIKLIFFPILVVIAFSLFPATNYFTNHILRPYQKERIEAFLNPAEKDQGSLWQVRQSQVAIGSGRLWGRGFLQGTQSKLRFLPFAHTDFIFAALAEQFGLVGSAFVLLLFAVLIARILNVASNSNDQFGTIVAVGIAAMLLLHIFINIGMNLGKLPVTGIPLPLVSYGGSSVLVNLIGLGLVQSIVANGKIVDSTKQLMVVSS